MIIVAMIHIIFIEFYIVTICQPTIRSFTNIIEFLVVWIPIPRKHKHSHWIRQLLVTELAIFYYSSQHSKEWAIELDMHTPSIRKQRDSGRFLYIKRERKCLAFSLRKYFLNFETIK